jgi:hypothetical protein
MLDRSLAAEESQQNPTGRFRALKETALRVIDQVGNDTYAARTLTRAIEAGDELVEQQPAKAVTLLSGEMLEVQQRLAFEPLKEADVPEGFPSFTTVGEVEVKQYPAYRMARTQSGAAAFWSLFSHIKKNGIPMTAPVQMDYRSDSSGRAEQAQMAFLYESTQQGSLGRDGRVAVMDVMPVTAVSTGVRGRRTRQQLEDARNRLERWLEANKDRYEASGSMRIMGYNSPFVPAERQYFEVQIPIEAVN